jgi:hypothetical protein
MGDDLPIKSTSEGLVSRAKGMIMQPRAEWQQVAVETTEPAKVFTTYALPLLLIGPIAAFIGIQLFGYGNGVFSFKLGLGAALGIAVTSVVTGIIGLFISAFVANLASPQFSGRNDFAAAFRLVAYAWTAAWIGGIFGLVPTIAPLSWLFGLYSLYVLYLGASPIMGIPQDKSLVYTIVTIVGIIVVQFVMYLIAGAIMASMFLASASAIAANDVNAATINLGELGEVTVDGDSQTVDLGELGRVEIDGDTATVSVDGQEIEVNTAALEAQAAALAAQAEAAKAAAAAE